LTNTPAEPPPELLDKAAVLIEQLGREIARLVMSRTTSPHIALGVLAKAADAILREAPPEKRQALLDHWLSCWSRSPVH
jgi:hypothetical protein